MPSTKKPTPRPTGFTDEERAAMKARTEELKAEARPAKAGDRAAGLAAVEAAIAAMPEPDRGLARRLHALILATAPGLEPKTWYGMPAYARQGQVLCFFQGAYKFKARYATLGFSDKARLDAGAMWPTSFAIARLTGEVETRIRDLVRQAAG
ncbi:MAG TPA: DUF1801 domain-containing protein [Terriglobales bacterium]|jgi:uncharacterized protein YdhG (YjbR/CyaY superfamily)